MKGATIVDEIIEITGIRDLKKMTEADTVKLLRLIGEQKLKEEHVRALVKIAPSFIGLAVESLKAISAVAKASGASQIDALQSVQQSISAISEALQVLAASAKSDKTREKLARAILEAGRLYVELARISQQMNANNNDFWLKLAGVAAMVLVAVLQGFVAANRAGNDEA